MPEVRIYGLPAPQGSKRAYVVPGTRRVSLVEMSTKVRPWRSAVAEAWTSRGLPQVPGTVGVQVTFILPRPRYHFGKGRNSTMIRPKYEGAEPGKFPDLDKLLRSTFDGLTAAEAWEDDSRVVHVNARKRYAHRDEEPGAVVRVFRWDGD